MSDSPIIQKYQGRSHYEADKQKWRMNKIGVWLKNTEATPYTEGEFSTILTFNFDKKPVRHDLKTMLLGFRELDDFLKRDEKGLIEFFEQRFGYINASNRLKKDYAIKPIRRKSLIVKKSTDIP